MTCTGPTKACPEKCFHLWNNNIQLHNYKLFQYDISRKGEPVREPLNIVMHTFLNYVVVQFYLELIAYLKGDDGFALLWEMDDDMVPFSQPQPPTIWQIPMSKWMKTPSPFRGSSKDFALSHLSIMATPEFLGDGAWVGYVAQNDEDQWEDIWRFQGVGVRYDVYGAVKRPGFNEKVEDACHFELENVISPSCFMMRSNFFTAGDTVFFLEITVSRETGSLVVAVVHPSGRRHLAYGALTPFGLVFQHLDSWHYYWKQSWSKEFAAPARTNRRPR
jgi:hypothetical protein